MAKSVPDPAEKKVEIPLVAQPVNQGEEPIKPRHWIDASLSVQAAAEATISAEASKLIVEASFKNGLGTHRPSELMVGLDTSNIYLYFVPVRPKTPGATDVKHDKSRIKLSLYQTFAKLDRLVPPDVREHYALKPTPGEVTIGNVKGWGVYTRLDEVEKQPITKLSDEEKARRIAKLRQTLAAKKARKQSAAAAEEPTKE